MHDMVMGRIVITSCADAGITLYKT